MNRLDAFVDSSTAVIRGVATFLPGARSAYRFLRRGTTRETGGTLSAEYCYSVWLRHLVYAHGAGLNVPGDFVAELGPGNSLGIGICALLSGASHYIALDAVRHAHPSDIDRLFDELKAMFRQRAPIPHGHFNGRTRILRPVLESTEFPCQILPDEVLGRAMEETRLEQIRSSLNQVITQREDSSQFITYCAPWDIEERIQPNSLDFVLSQYVLEHVDRLQESYQALFTWLKPGAGMSHQIDYHSHGLSRQWNGHWTFSDPAWRLIRGRRSFLINRDPHSRQVAAATAAGFRVIYEKKTRSATELTPDVLAARFRSLSNENLTTSSCLMQCVKPD